MTENLGKPKPQPPPQPAAGRRSYRRLRALQRVGLLAPLLKLQRKLEGR
jgi:hypothetical protein